MEEKDKIQVCKSSVILARLDWITAALFVAAGIALFIKYNGYVNSIIGLSAYISAFIFFVDGCRMFRQRNMSKYRFRDEEKDGRRVRKNFSAGISGWIISTLFFGTCVLVVANMYDYQANAPKIFAESQVTVHTGDVLEFDDLAEVRIMDKSKRIDKSFSYHEEKTEGMDSYISEDGKKLIIGENKGSFTVRLVATTYEIKEKTIEIYVE